MPVHTARSTDHNQPETSNERVPRNGTLLLPHKPASRKTGPSGNRWRSSSSGPHTSRRSDGESDGLHRGQPVPEVSLIRTAVANRPNEGYIAGQIHSDNDIVFSKIVAVSRSP